MSKNKQTPYSQPLIEANEAILKRRHEILQARQAKQERAAVRDETPQEYQLRLKIWWAEVTGRGVIR